MEKIVQTAKQTVKAIVLDQSARPAPSFACAKSSDIGVAVPEQSKASLRGAPLTLLLADDASNSPYAGRQQGWLTSGVALLGIFGRIIGASVRRVFELSALCTVGCTEVRQRSVASSEPGRSNGACAARVPAREARAAWLPVSGLGQSLLMLWRAAKGHGGYLSQRQLSLGR
jgi:hypothetical protein